MTPASPEPCHNQFPHFLTVISCSSAGAIVIVNGKVERLPLSDWRAMRESYSFLGHNEEHVHWARWREVHCASELLHVLSRHVWWWVEVHCPSCSFVVLALRLQTTLHFRCWIVIDWAIWRHALPSTLASIAGILDDVLRVDLFANERTLHTHSLMLVWVPAYSEQLVWHGQDSPPRQHDRKTVTIARASLSAVKNTTA